MKMVQTNETEVRLPRDDAERLVEAYLSDVTPNYPTYSLVEDGETGWAFWIDPNDTTSYVHSDGKIQWCGSEWPENVDYDGDTGRFIEKQSETAATMQDKYK